MTAGDRTGPDGIRSGGVRMLGAAVLAVAAVAAAGCSGGSEMVPGDAAPLTEAASTPGTGPAAATSAPAAATSGPAAPTSPAPEPTASGPAALAGNNFGDITAVDTVRRTVTVDVVEYFSGPAAAKACAEDGRAPAGAYCSTYYVRNNNPLERTIPLAARATITVVSFAATGVNAATPATLAQVDNLLTQQNFYRLRVDDGEVTELEGVYLP